MSTTIDDSSATPELWAALVEAQGLVGSVGKDGRNTQRGYNYTTSEAVFRAARAHLNEAGIAFVSTFTDEGPPPATGDIGKQHVCALVRIQWMLVHRAGGVLRGAATMAAVGSPARPNDKAVAATVTYALGFILRGLLLIDRAEEDEIAVDRRDDPALDRLHDLTDRLARARKVDYQVAQDLVCTAADTWPSGSPTTKQVAALTAAAQLLLEQRDTPPPKSEPSDLEVAKATLAAAVKRYREHEEAEYLNTECKSPSKTVVDQIRAKALKIACKGAGLDQWPGAGVTLEQLQAAAKALEDAMAAEQEPTPREAWREAQNAYIDAMARDHLHEEGQEPDADALAGMTAQSLVISAKAVGAKKWPARPSDEQLATAAAALREAAEAARS